MTASSGGYERQYLEVLEELLGLPRYRIEGLLERHTLQLLLSDPPFFRFEKGISGIESGTAVFYRQGEVVCGFPKIKRAMYLETALKNHFRDRVVVEEKMNGYNVRAACIDGRLIALTRGGYPCPYTTEKVEELAGPEFFSDHPDLVLCGEMVGPDNPYVPKHSYPIQSLEFYIFDIQEKNTGRPLPVKKRQRLLQEYNLKPTPPLGEYSILEAPARIKELIKKLGEEGREGVVIKDPDMKIPPVKYTASQSNLKDLEYAFTYYNDYGRDFFFSRIVREAFQSVEWQETPLERQERCKRLGESILLPMTSTIDAIKRGEKITEKTRIRVKSLETAARFREHLRLLGIDATFSPPQKIGDHYLIQITKNIQSTNDKTRSILEGHLWT